MSNFGLAQHAQLQTSAPVQPLFRRKVVIYPILAVLIVLGIAWFDGGEEPLRPIVQAVEQPAKGASS